MYLCMVMEVIQKKIAATTMVMIPGTQPKTLQETNYQSSREGDCLGLSIDESDLRERP